MYRARRKFLSACLLIANAVNKGTCPRFQTGAGN